MFGDTVGDARNIIGSIDENLFDKRAKNALMYSSPNAGGFQANVMYSTSWEGNTTAQAGQDNNKDNLMSVNFLYKIKTFTLATGLEQQKHVDATPGDTTHKGTGTRLVGTYALHNIRFGLIYENLDDDTHKDLRRTAYGANFVHKTGNGKVKLQYIQAGDTDATSASGATEVAVGYDYKLDKNSSTYIAYSSVSNDKNASYVMGNGHDQKYTTTAGENINALSAGYIYSF